MGIYDRDWFWEERDRRERRRSRSKREWWKRALLGALIAVVGISAVMAIRMWIVQKAFADMQREVLSVSERMQRQAHASSQRMLAEQERQREARQVLDQARRQSMADADSARALAHRAQLAERERKEGAWADYYQPPPQCDNANPSIDLVDCANRHIRAKRDFEVKYEAGHI